MLEYFLWIWNLGSLTTIVQKILVAKLKNNVQFNLNSNLILFLSSFVGILYFKSRWDIDRETGLVESGPNTIVSDFCSQHIPISAEEQVNINYQFTMMVPRPD